METKTVKGYSYKFLFVLILIFLSHYSFAQDSLVEVEKRGVVVYPSDLISLGADWWVEMMIKSDLNLLGVHTNTLTESITDLKVYLESEEGKKLIRMCQKNGISIEFEMHVLEEVLSRELFIEHPDYFRMDSKGNRQQMHNMCFSSEEAYHEIEKKLVEITKWLKPSTHRYFFWTDDVKHAFCHCEKCKGYSASEQALVFENKLLKMLRKIDPKATVAHLAYHNTLAAPVKIKPLEGIFLEYAPINRDYKDPLSDEHLQSLYDNLDVFPKETAHILEYWLDVSMFSGWKKEELTELVWKQEQCERDV